ncbi:MAG: serine/threonine protein kinase [Myxococcaceae bacterium]|nr:serine/threonine protein kinase [Myxococcaceae bacterium]
MGEVPTPDSLAPGEFVGPWRLERGVGCGAYGVVYRARLAGHPECEPVALKLALLPEDARFVREVKLLRRIHHPAVPGFVDRGWWRSEDGQVHPYVVMQWVEGLALYDWAELNAASSRQVLHVLARVARALEATHVERCLHRDVKGDNIRVAPNGLASLLDFGSGTWAGAPLITDGPMPPGTGYYRSPEALRFQWDARRLADAHYEATPADDVYALGVAMYRVVAGVHPPPGTDPEGRQDKLRPPLPPRLLPQALNGWVNPELASLIEWMLAAEPQRRPSAREAAQAAEAAARRAGSEADVPLSGAVPVRAQPRPVQVRVALEPRGQGLVRLPWCVPAAVVILFMVGWWLMNRSPMHWQPEEEEAPMLAEAEAPDAGSSRDGGTADLGDTAMTARAPSQDVPGPSKRIAMEVPDEPLDGQQRPPCSRGEIEINGGCWAWWGHLTPPCGERAYEWRGRCYLPLLKKEKPRPPTTKKPR